jgi:uncharacterized protein (TIGR02145 family)
MSNRIYKTILAASCVLALQCGLFEPREDKGSISIMIQHEGMAGLAKPLETLSSVRYILKQGSSTVRDGYLSRNGNYFESTISDLEPGSYSVDVYGYDSSGGLVGTGNSGLVSVSAGNTATASISWGSFKPTLSSPTNGSTGISTSPTLSWNSVSGATSYGLQVSANSGFASLVVDQSGITTTSRQVTGLSEGTPYYWRVNATGSGGTSSWSGSWYFATSGSQSGTMTDIDGNVYHTVTVGNQVWTVENLRVTHYRNGDAIPNITDNSLWYSLTSGAYCNYDNNTNYTATYGRLYNWYAVADSRNIAPAGWHVPTDAEWQTLIDYLGGTSVAGGKMKEAGTTHWYSPNAGATNESGFSALPGGYRYDYGGFDYLGFRAGFWSSSEYETNYAWTVYQVYDSSITSPYLNSGQYGLSVRLVRD